MNSAVLCLVPAPFGRRRAETLLDAVVSDVGTAAHEHWHGAFSDGLADRGEFSHGIVTVTAGGKVTDGATSLDLLAAGFRHEIDGDVLRLSSGGVSIDWPAGMAAIAFVPLLYGLRQRLLSVSRKRSGPATEVLRKKAEQRIGSVVRDLATVIARADIPEGRRKLVLFLASRGLPMPEERFVSVAKSLLVRKSYIQKAFEDIMRFNRRASRHGESERLFDDLAAMAVTGGRVDARQMFALYEIGLHLGYSLPRITAMISAVMAQGDPQEAGRNADRLEAERRRRRAEERARADAFGDFGEPDEGVGELDVPPALVPMLAVLGLERLVSERDLRAAWTARVRQCHPDTLPPGSAAELVEAANAAAAECNRAYSIILDYIRA